MEFKLFIENIIKRRLTKEEREGLDFLINTYRLSVKEVYEKMVLKEKEKYEELLNKKVLGSRELKKYLKKNKNEQKNRRVP